MSATVLGYEGRRDHRSVVAWGAAAILVDDELVNGASGLRRRYTDEEFAALVSSGSISKLDTPITLKQYRAADRPLVVELAIAFLDEFGFGDLAPRKGLRGSGDERGSRIFVFADMEAFNEYRRQIADRVIAKVLDLEDMADEAARVSKRRRLLQAGLTLHGHDGALNAFSAFFDEEFQDDRPFALKMANARVREPLERRQMESVFRALMAAEAATKAERDGAQVNGEHEYTLQYKDGVADAGGLALKDAALIVGSVYRLDGFAGSETIRQFPFLSKPPSTQLRSISPGSARLHFAPTVAGEPFADRVARYLNLTILQDIIDGKLAEVVEERAAAQVVRALKVVVQPSPATHVEHRPIDALNYTPVDSDVVVEDEERGEPKGPPTSEPLVLLGYQSGLLQDWGKLEICTFPGTRIRLDSDRNDLGHAPLGIDVLKQRNDFLFRPALFTLVRERLASGRRKYWLREVRLIEPGGRQGGTITAIPSAVVPDAFIYRLDLAVSMKADGSLLRIRRGAEGEVLAELAVPSREISGAQAWMRAYEDTCETVELADFRTSRLGPVYMPSASPLQRVLVVVQEAGGTLDLDDAAQRIKDQFVGDVRVDIWAVLRKFPAFVKSSDGSLALTERGQAFAKAYLAIERRSVTSRRPRRGT